MKSIKMSLNAGHIHVYRLKLTGRLSGTDVPIEVEVLAQRRFRTSMDWLIGQPTVITCARGHVRFIGIGNGPALGRFRNAGNSGHGQPFGPVPRG